MAVIEDDDCTRLERAIDAAEEGLAPLKSFVLPGGTAAAAELHVARCVVRRAERLVVALAAEETVRAPLVVYLNRLSDLLFTLARRANHLAGEADVPWIPRNP
jgi:cob(I)alamin adenosyltransferase